MTTVLSEAGDGGGDVIWESPGIGVMLLPSLYTPHPGVNATIAPSGLSLTQSHIYPSLHPGSPGRLHLLLDKPLADNADNADAIRAKFL
jgi:hypothetical protein